MNLDAFHVMQQHAPVQSDGRCLWSWANLYDHLRASTMPAEYGGKELWPAEVLDAKAWCWYEPGRRTAPSSFQTAFKRLTQRLGIVRTAYGQKSEKAPNVVPPDGHYGIAVNPKLAGLYVIRRPLSLCEDLEELGTYVEASRAPGACTVWLRASGGPYGWQDVTGSGCQTLPTCAPMRAARAGEVAELEALMELLW